MKITLAYLKKINACSEAIDEFKKRDFKSIERTACLKLLIHENKLGWANWLFCMTATRKQKLVYAIYAAEQVLHIYEKKYPDDKRPREAIEAARAVLKKDNKKNREKAAAAGDAAGDAARGAGAAAWDAAWAAAWAAAWDAAWAAWAAAGDAAWDAWAAAGAAMMKKILQNGIKILGDKE